MRWVSTLALLLCLVNSVRGDDPSAQKASGPDPKLVETIRGLGGNVMEIAQNDSRLDVTLHLADKDVKDEHLTAVAGLPDVAWLNLAGTKITDEGLKHLSGMKSLEKLHLERTAIGDAGLAHLSGLENLVYLNLYGTKVTDKGLEHLHGLKNLRKLYVWQTGVTAEGRDALKQKLPELEVIAGLELNPAEPAEEKPEEKEKGE